MQLEGVTAGVPDLVVCLPGRIAFVELKARTGVISTKQREVMQRLTGLDLSVHVCYSIDEFQDAIKYELTNLNGTNDLNH